MSPAHVSEYFRILVRKNSNKGKSISLDSFFEAMGADYPIDQDPGLLSHEPHFGGEVVSEFKKD